jgi:hypothetical protein
MMRYQRSTAFAAIALAATLPGMAGAQYWSRSWAAAVQASPAPESDRALPNLKDKTVRQIVRLSAGGRRFCLRLSNELTPADIRIGTVRVALIGADGAIVAGSAREVRFAGRAIPSIWR